MRSVLQVCLRKSSSAPNLVMKGDIVELAFLLNVVQDVINLIVFDELLDAFN